MSHQNGPLRRFVPARSVDSPTLETEPLARKPPFGTVCAGGKPISEAADEATIFGGPPCPAWSAIVSGWSSIWLGVARLVIEGMAMAGEKAFPVQPQGPIQ